MICSAPIRWKVSKQTSSSFGDVVIDDLYTVLAVAGWPVI